MEEKDVQQRNIYSKTSWVDRNGFAHWAMALLWLFAALILFQVVAGVALALFLLISGEISTTDELLDTLTRRTDLLFIGNSIGQILFIGLATFLIARAHVVKESMRGFLRLNWTPNTPRHLGYGAVLVVVIQPLIIYLGYLNSLLPIPEVFSEMQMSQHEMIEDFLTSEGVLLFGLFHIAVVPSLCEEVLFRGYILRAFEKSWGIVAGVIVSGIIFGMFHLQLGNILPLATLGIILGLMTWLSGSIWPAVLAHFINNGSAVVLGVNFPELLFSDINAESLPPIWVLILSIMLTGAVIYRMFQQAEQTTEMV
jgi:membrane protease YdiL (CAAX protease family)